VARELLSKASSQRLLGQCVALTGRLATLSRAEARRIVAAQGGRTSSAVTRETTMLVVGQEAWPLRKDGRLNANLRRAHRLQESGHKLEVLGEQAFLDHLGLEEFASGICARHTIGQLTRLLNVPRARVEAWLRHGLIQPAETLEGLPVFDFRQVAAIKALCELKQSGVSTARLRRSLKQLSIWLPDAEDALLRLSAAGGQLLVRDSHGGLAEPNGQRWLEFQRCSDEAASDGPTVLGTPISADELFRQAVEHEEAGRLREAADAYHRWLHDFGPDARVCFNLGNVLSASRKPEAAIERFRQAIELNANYVEAWNNLGLTLIRIGQREQAVSAFTQALQREPSYADALYNLADTLDELCRCDEAQRYWRSYLACDATGPWADYARGRLSPRGA
jgi:tetratricopeptide (TPR) repeat protein